jgi:hypothetical protein
MLLDDAVSWAKERFSYAKMRRDYETAPPTNRKFDEGFVLLGRRDEHGVLRPIGAFLPELYVMAKAGKLPCQQPGNKNSGYAKRGDTAQAPKSHFELAILPAITYGEIEDQFKTIVGLRAGNKVNLPAPIPKYRILPDYLPHLAEMGLEVYPTPKRVAVDDKTMNIRNPVGSTTAFERGLHYGSQWMAWFLALSVGLETALAVGFTMPLAVLPFVLGYLTHKCSKDFMLFSIVEGLLRDIGWMFDKEYSLKGKISLWKSLETSIYLAGIGYAIHGGVLAAWSSTVGMSIWSTMTALGAPALMVSGLSLLAAGSFAVTAGLGIWLGLSAAIRYFWTFSCFDNEINPKDVKDVVGFIPFVDRGPDASIVNHLVNVQKDVGKLDCPDATKIEIELDTLEYQTKIFDKIRTSMSPETSTNEEDFGAEDKERRVLKH